MTLIKETDYGTPEVTSTKMVTLEIDGQQITVPEGTSIMRAAMELGTKIPKLCATDMLDAFGSCRLCLVEVEGRPGTPASCTSTRSSSSQRAAIAISPLRTLSARDPPPTGSSTPGDGWRD